ncbi:MAG: (Fe-S)-binding protein [Oscillospiraceae bacterium]|nr:(Fe-S)-binding protein [Oscillospiraceae bacterium]
MSDLKKFKYTMDSCNHCGQCKWILTPKMDGWDFAQICPIHLRYGFDAYSGQGLINIAKEVMNGTLQYGDGLEDLLYTCTACGACDVNCKNVRDMELLDTILELRAHCVENGALPNAHKQTSKNIENSHNIYGLPHEDRFSWLPEDYADDENADTALFVGCSVYKHPEPALAAIKILRAGGVKFKLLREDEWCCGSMLWRTGQNEKAAALVSRNREVFKKHGIKTVITACAECFGSFRAGYTRFGENDFEVLHITQVAADLIKEGKLTFKNEAAPIRVTYHDPCMLARLSEPYIPWEGVIHPYGRHEPEKQWRRGELGVYDAPRQVLNALPGVELCEMVRNRENAFCCGGGSVDPEFTKWAAAERRREASSTGADAIVSCCPFCRDSLEDGEENPMQYLDLTELLAKML